MKSFLLLTFAFAIITLSQAMTSDERKAFETKLAADCKAKESASDDDVKSLIEREIPTTTSGKCLHACIHETLGLVKDGKGSIDGAVEIAKLAYNGDEKAVALAKEIITECADVTDADRCELALKMMECAQTAASKRGVNPKKII